MAFSIADDTLVWHYKQVFAILISAKNMEFMLSDIYA
jgi:hypothetical protein